MSRCKHHTPAVGTVYHDGATFVAETRTAAGRRAWLMRDKAGHVFVAEAKNVVSGKHQRCSECSAKRKHAVHRGVLPRSQPFLTDPHENAARLIPGRVNNDPRYARLEHDPVFRKGQKTADRVAWLREELGPYPDDGQRYTVDRLAGRDGVGYVRGAVAWRTQRENMRNKVNNALAVNPLTGAVDFPVALFLETLGHAETVTRTWRGKRSTLIGRAMRESYSSWRARKHRDRPHAEVLPLYLAAHPEVKFPPDKPMQDHADAQNEEIQFAAMVRYIVFEKLKRDSK